MNELSYLGQWKLIVRTKALFSASFVVVSADSSTDSFRKDLHLVDMVVRFEKKIKRNTLRR